MHTLKALENSRYIHVVYLGADALRIGIEWRNPHVSRPVYEFKKKLFGCSKKKPNCYLKVFSLTRCIDITICIDFCRGLQCGHFTNKHNNIYTSFKTITFANI